MLRKNHKEVKGYEGFKGIEKVLTWNWLFDREYTSRCIPHTSSLALISGQCPAMLFQFAKQRG